MPRRHTKKKARRHSRQSRKRGGVYLSSTNASQKNTAIQQNTATVIAQLQEQLADLQRQRKEIEDELARRAAQEKYSGVGGMMAQ